VHIKKRGNRAMLYRSVWVKKNTEEGNTHGFSRQTFVGSVPVDAEAIPDDIKSRLSGEEIAFLDRTLIGPARAAAETARRVAEQRLRDPMWRLEEAARFIREAASLSADALVPQGRIASVAEALSAVKSFGGPPSRQEVQKTDPLGAALDAIRTAARAVGAGHYGTAPDEGVRSSKVYGNWMEICRAVEGGLLRALQARGWVKAKGR
jgi:hypothetical protein